MIEDQRHARQSRVRQTIARSEYVLSLPRRKQLFQAWRRLRSLALTAVVEVRSRVKMAIKGTEGYTYVQARMPASANATRAIGGARSTMAKHWYELRAAEGDGCITAATLVKISGTSEMAETLPVLQG